MSELEFSGTEVMSGLSEYLFKDAYYKLCSDYIEERTARMICQFKLDEKERAKLP